MAKTDPLGLTGKKDNFMIKRISEGCSVHVYMGVHICFKKQEEDSYRWFTQRNELSLDVS